MEGERYIEATRARTPAVVNAQEKERAHTGDELHDDINEALSAAKRYLALAKNAANDRINLIAQSAHNIMVDGEKIRKLCKSVQIKKGGYIIMAIRAGLFSSKIDILIASGGCSCLKSSCPYKQEYGKD